MTRAYVQKAKAAAGATGSTPAWFAATQRSSAIQRRSNGQSQPASIPPIVHSVLRSPGQPLDAATRAFMEPRFAHDFSKVRVHADGKAAESARAVNALAYAVGEHVAFRAEKYAPGTTAGRHLLAHELAHVVQQSRGGDMMADPEVLAHSAARRITSGQAVDHNTIGSAPPGLHLQKGTSGVFDPETATQRIKGTSKIKQFRLVDANGERIRYDNDETMKGDIYLPEGTLVSKLENNPNAPNYIHVIAWHNMKYREGYIHETAFSDNYEGGSSFDVEVFIDDAYHAVHRAEMLLKGKQPDDKSFQHLRSMLSKTENYLAAYKQGKIQITAEMLDKIKREDETLLKIDQSDKPGTISRQSSAIFAGADPMTSDQISLSASTLFVPLSDAWFQSDETLKEHFGSALANTANFSARIGGTPASGEGIETSDKTESDLKEWFAEFYTLRDLIRGRPVANSPEGKWLETITSDKSIQNRIKRMIFLHGPVWPAIANSTSRYADKVALSTSFGPIQANPMMLLLMHELNVNTNRGVALMGEDSHVDPEATKTAWESAEKGKFAEVVAKDTNQLDDLFQAQSGIALTILFRYLEKIKGMQPSENQSPTPPKKEKY